MRRTRLSHRSHTCEVDECSQRFGAEQQLKEHVRKVHTGFDSRRVGEKLKINKIQLQNLEKAETFEDLDEEEILDKFNELAIFDAISFADQKDNFVSGRRNVEELAMRGHLDWIHSEVAMERIERVIRGEFHSRRHNLFLER